MMAHRFIPFPAFAHSGNLTQLLFLTQVLATLAMLGLIWFVQVVHYPLFLTIPEPGFMSYETSHATRTGWIAAPLMAVELLSALLLLVPHLRPVFVSHRTAQLGMVLVVLLWLSTGLIQVPLHNQLHQRYDRAVIQRLITSNWLRTALWTARAALMLFWICASLPS